MTYGFDTVPVQCAVPSPGSQSYVNVSVPQSGLVSVPLSVTLLPLQLVCGAVGLEATKGIVLAWGCASITLVSSSASMTTAAIVQNRANRFFILANLRSLVNNRETDRKPPPSGCHRAVRKCLHATRTTPAKPIASVEGSGTAGGAPLLVTVPCR